MHDHRFFIDQPLEQGATIDLPTDEAHHATRVLRIGQGDNITLFDGRGNVATARVVTAAARQVQAEVISIQAIKPTLPLINAHIPWLKQPQRLDWAIEKLAELGTSTISVHGLPQGRGDKRAERWRRLAISAAKQSGAATLTEISEIADALEPVNGLGILLSEKRDAPPLRDVIGDASPDEITLCVGPEAGFSDADDQRATEAGWRIASLGPQRLRSETAAVVGVGAVVAMNRH